MLPVGWLVFAVVLAVLLTMWVTFTLTRLDRLHARVDAAFAALDAQLVRRAAALLSVAEASGALLSATDRAHADAVARAALERGATHAVDGPRARPVDASDPEREAAENAVGRAAVQIVTTPGLPAERENELREAAVRVLIARRFYNDAVRDTRNLRARRMPRVLHLAGRRALPDFFDIDDTQPEPAAERVGEPTTVPPADRT